MLFSLDVIRARKGDCLILHYGSQDNPHLVMIDGGPRGVYVPHLRPRLEKIREMRSVKEDEPLQVDLLMVSHVDDDHIQGILDLTSEVIESRDQSQPQLVQVLTFWHNGFENDIGNVPPELTAAFSSPSTPSIEEDPPDLASDVEEEEEEEEAISANHKVLASIQQGAQLRRNVIENLKRPLNEDFDGGLILATENGKAIDMDNGLEFTVAGPMVRELKKLYAKHQAWLKDLAKEGKTPEDVLSAYADKSPPNLSSIVVLAEAGGKRMLLTGDARGDKIMEGLELVGLMEKDGKMQVDILKVPHHGSSNNLDDDFFERIIAKHYVFSGDGEHGNPERETMEMLLKARGDANYKIHLTYPIDEIDAGRKKDWEKEQRKEQTKKEKKPDKVVREDWSPPEHSLQALFDAHPDFAKKVSAIVEDDEPHVIDLLDEVGF